jgi:hypothetical protein
MSLSTAVLSLGNGLKTLNALWEEVRPGWNDPVGRDFESNHWAPLRGQVEATLQAVERLAPVLERALRETSPSAR